ncbi:MAG TPA: hypothetical protein VER96_22325 [Polyangiaceae bacterium]|nr:hypothetical protein [Polyangiaceae bacterium]
MSHIHFVGGEKGGVGKSVVARLLAQWFIDRALPFAAVDGDLSHGALVRMYADYSQPVDLANPESADQIVDRALGADRRVLVDLPAQSVRTLHNWLSEANVFAFAKEAGIRMSFWHVTDGGFASVGEIERSLDLFGDRFEHKVVRNFGRSKNFTQFDESKAKQKLDQLAGKIIDLPELDAQAMFKVDRLGASFWGAIHSTGEDGPKPLERQRVRLWLERSYAQLESAFDAI